jgi:hypothetical protein
MPAIFLTLMKNVLCVVCTCLDTVWTVLTCLNLSWHSLNCLYMSELVLTVWTVLTCLNLSWHNLNLSWHSLNCLNMSELYKFRHVQTVQTVSRQVQTCLNSSDCVKTSSDMLRQFRLCQDKLTCIFHTNNQLISPVQVFRCLDWKIYFCIISACNCRFKSNEKNIAC